MSLSTWLYQKTCIHSMMIKRTSLSTATITNTRTKHEIICAKCGKVIVSDENFDEIADFFGGEGTARRMRNA